MRGSRNWQFRWTGPIGPVIATRTAASTVVSTVLAGTESVGACMSACHLAYPPKIFICTNTQLFHDLVPCWQSWDKQGANLGGPLLASHVAIQQSWAVGSAGGLCAKPVVWLADALSTQDPGGCAGWTMTKPRTSALTTSYAHVQGMSSMHAACREAGIWSGAIQHQLWRLAGAVGASGTRLSSTA